MISDVKTSLTNGHRLDQYVLFREIGQGGHGIVYQAYHEDRPNEVVAVKIVKNTGNLDTLLVEPQMLSQLQHSNIVGLQDYFLHGEKLVLVMDYIEGVDLKSFLEQHGRFTPAEIKTFLNQMASALSYAHSQNIMHRDLKLSNILVTDVNGNRQYILVDFGISRITGGIQTVRRRGGTLSYMSPEQLRGRPSEQSDLWALGVITYTLLTGAEPFEEDTREDLCRAILYSIPPLPSIVLTEEVNADLERIIYHLLEKEPISRTLSADDLLAELEEWSLPSLEQVVPSDYLTGSRSPVPTWEQQKRRAVKKSWVLLCVFLLLATIPEGIVAGILIIGGVIIFYIGQEKDQSIYYTIIGFGLILAGYVVSVITGFMIATLLGWGEAELDAFSEVEPFLTLLSIPFYLAALHYLVKIRRLERDTFLLKALRTGSLNPERFIDLLGDFVDVHLGDLNVHQKYVETLLMFGRAKEAIVEARRVIDVDPYNFGATLLLAQGYYEVGLIDECIQVCNGYLAVSGYSFEFSELKDQCKAIIGGEGYGQVRRKI